MNDAITKLNLEDLENVAGGKSGEEGSSMAVLALCRVFRSPAGQLLGWGA